MKKTIVIAMIGLLVVPAVMAQRVPTELKPEAVYEATGVAHTSYEKIMQKIQNRQRIDIADIPYGYNWNGGNEYQLDKNVFYTAKAVYEKHPQSFNAAYNYGVLIYYTVEAEIGLMTTAKQLDAAYAVFEKAKEINPKVEGVYRHQIIILQEKILKHAQFMEEPGGFSWDKYTRGVIQDPAYHYLTRQLLSNITELFKIHGVVRADGSINTKANLNESLVFDAWSAYELCTALNRTEQAAQWKELAKKWDADYQKAEKAKERQAKISAKALKKELNKTLIKSAYLEALKNLSQTIK